MGVSAAGALASYILLAAILTLAVLAGLVYPVTVVAGRVPLRRLVEACAPAQAVALSSRSTMASLLAMIDAAKTLGVPGHVTAFVVPLAASMLRVGSAVGQTVAVLFAARLFDVEISPLHLAVILVVTVLTTFTGPGIPGGSIVVMVPILLAANVPADAVGILLGADVIPDMFRTLANVTGGIAAAAIVGRPDLNECSGYSRDQIIRSGRHFSRAVARLAATTDRGCTASSIWRRSRSRVPDPSDRRCRRD